MYYIARYPNKDNVTVWRTTPLFANKVTLKAVVSGTITLDSTYVYGTTFDSIKDTVVGTSKSSSEALGIALLEKMKIEEDQIEEQKRQKQRKEQEEQDLSINATKMKSYLASIQSMMDSMDTDMFKKRYFEEKKRRSDIYNIKNNFINDYHSFL